jgi:signal transduction histidine kinase
MAVWRISTRRVPGASASSEHASRGKTSGLRASPVASRALPWVSSMVYGVVLIAGLYYSVAGLGSGTSQPIRVAGFVAALAVLFVLEAAEPRRYAVRTPPWPALVFLVIRLGLFVAVAAFDNSGLSRALFVLVPFAAYFAFGRMVSLALAGVCLVVLLAGYLLWVPHWYTDVNYVSDIVMFCIGLVLAISMAGIAVGEQEGRVRLEGTLRDLENSHAQLTVYAARVADLSAAAERNRLARDIHDSLGHHLTAIAVQLEKASAFQDRDQSAAKQALANARSSARRALDDVRVSVRALRVETGPLSLSAMLADLVRQADDGHQRVTLSITGEESGTGQAAATVLYRAAQEALTNASCHGHARNVSISVTFDESGARLVVDDDGNGFTVAPSAGAVADGFGLLGMTERAALVGGTVEIKSQLGAGTRVTVAVPGADASPPMRRPTLEETFW